MLKTLGVGAAGVAAIGVNGTVARQPQLATIATFDPPQLPENIAVGEDGTHYLSMATTGEIWELTPGDDVSPSSVASLPVPSDQQGPTLLGIVIASDDSALYACFNSGEADTHGVWRVPLDDGSPEAVATVDPNESTLNGITGDALEDGAFLVTDHQRGAIWRVSDDGAEIWLESQLLVPNPYADLPVGVDGIAVGPDGDVWVDNLSFGSILRIPVESDGSAGEPAVFAYTEELVGADGLTVDSDGVIYVAVNVRNAVVRIDRDGRRETLVSGEILDFPSDVHLGRSDGTQRTLYFTNFALLSAGAEGRQAAPSYMSVDLEQTGTTAGTPGGTPTETPAETPAETETETPTETDGENASASRR